MWHVLFIPAPSQVGTPSQAASAKPATRGRTAARARRARRGRTKPQQVLQPAPSAGSGSTATPPRHRLRRRAWHALRTHIQLKGVLASTSAIATPDTGRRQATMRVASAILATTTASQIGTSAPSAREGFTPLPWPPRASKLVSHVRLARGRRRAVQPARCVLHIPIQLGDQLF